jgi:hypothetical protein
MAEGWYVTTRRSDPKGDPDLHGRFLAHVADRQKAIALVARLHPDAMILADQEATLEQFEKYDVKLGAVRALWEAQ